MINLETLLVIHKKKNKKIREWIYLTLIIVLGSIETQYFHEILPISAIFSSMTLTKRKLAVTKFLFWCNVAKSGLSFSSLHKKQLFIIVQPLLFGWSIIRILLQLAFYAKNPTFIGTQGFQITSFKKGLYFLDIKKKYKDSHKKKEVQRFYWKHFALRF